ncbi:MAG: sensor histidine kinase [Bacillus sp. (in: Bacteria)]|nr:sensor histidine kinase [Bacillus sp. (in: firmicutes)]MCM1426569.1 sensor histidine kinase [Eubacterium sp.]
MEKAAAAKVKLHRFFSTIRARILLYTISLILFICIIITAVSYFLVSYNLRHNLIQTSETRLSFLGDSIDANVNNVTNFVHACQTSTKIIQFALESDPTDNKTKREARDFVSENYTANAALPSQLVRMVIIGKNRNGIIQVVEPPYSTVSVSADAILSLPYFASLHDNTAKAYAGIHTDPFYTAREIPMIPFVYPIVHPYKADEIGYIYTEMSLSVITEPIQDYLSETDSRFFFRIDEHLYQFQDNALAPFDDTLTIVKDLSDTALSPDTMIQTVYDENTQETFTIVTRPLGTNGWYITEYVDETQLSHSVFSVLFSIVLIVIAASSIIGIFLSYFLSRTVNAPVKQLQSRIKRIEEGDFSRDLSTEWEHELGDIGKTINDLSENVLQLMNQRVEDERQKKDYEYRMLQSQINPHFLYNTLNSIKWMATVQNSPGIAEMTTSLSRLLKDIAKGTTSLVSIKHELSLINDYFIIQQYRYGGAITLEIDIEDESLSACQILKFTLQPLVENAIFHGIEPKGTTGSILIHIYQDEESDIHIDVTDDGVGMEPELAASLLEREAPVASSLFKEIGISNVHKRLQYEFGSKYGLSIASEPGKFTTISILLPFRKSEEVYD